MTVKKCQTQVCGSHRLQKQKVFRLPPAAPGHLIFLRGCFANSSPRGASSSPFHLQLLTNMSALHFVKVFKAVHALCCSLLKHFHIFSHRTEVSSVLNCNACFSVALYPFYSQVKCLHTRVMCSLPALPLLSLVGLTCRGQAQQCKSAPESGMQLISSQLRGLEQHHTLHFLRRGPGIWEEGTQ